MIKIRFLFLLLLLIGCAKEHHKIQWITIDPGHFHAALVQKTMYPEIDPKVPIYAPKSSDLDLHLKRIEAYNLREINPTSWELKTYAGSDFFETFLKNEKEGVVMLSGNNQKKTDYILNAVKNGFHVYADKPMVIIPEAFKKLEAAFEIAKENQLLIYDIMTERSEITTVLQKELSKMERVFGSLIKGTKDTPAILKSSTHHFSKQVSGQPLIRPAWFFDSQQQGEGLVDVSSHLVDLVFWESFPEQAIEKEELKLIHAERWATPLSKVDFEKVTSLKNYPDYLKQYLKKDSLFVHSNGSINFTLKGHHAKVEVIWNFEAPEGTGDTHYSIMRGSKATLEIVQGPDEKYIPSLYINPISELNPNNLKKAVESLSKKYSGIGLTKSGDRWKVVIPKELRKGHEAHFAAVTRRFIQYYNAQKLPNWEVTNILSKYYLTTSPKLRSRVFRKKIKF